MSQLSVHPQKKKKSSKNPKGKKKVRNKQNQQTQGHSNKIRISRLQTTNLVETGKQKAKANIMFPLIPPKLFLNSVLYYYYYFLARNFVTWRIFF
jgi:hypothetical protein